MTESRRYAVSASQLEACAACPRRWGWQTLARLRSPQTPASALGDKVHKELEEYMKTGKFPELDKEAARLARKALPHLPPWGVGEPETTFRVDYAGVLWAGRIDYQHKRVIDGTSKYVKVITDYKTTGSPRYAKNVECLRTQDPQSLLYTLVSGEDEVQLKWLYIPTKADDAGNDLPAFPVVAHLRRWEAEKSFAPWLDLAKQMVRLQGLVAEKQNTDAIAAEVLALSPHWNRCRDFGGCPWRHLC